TSFKIPWMLDSVRRFSKPCSRRLRTVLSSEPAPFLNEGGTYLATFEGSEVGATYGFSLTLVGGVGLSSSSVQACSACESPLSHLSSSSLKPSKDDSLSPSAPSNPTSLTTYEPRSESP